MRYLFIDTSLADVSIAVIEDNKILSSIHEYIPNEHSIYAVSYVDKVLKKANLEANDIDKILIVTGPGSFTGVRIGVTIAKMYAYLLEKEVIPVSSLKSRVLGKKSNYFLSMIDAKNNNYYVGLYDNNYNEIKESFMKEEEILKLKQKYNPLVVNEEDSYDLLEIVSYYKDNKGVNVHSLVPNYLKLPQALEDRI